MQWDDICPSVSQLRSSAQVPLSMGVTENNVKPLNAPLDLTSMTAESKLSMVQAPCSVDRKTVRTSPESSSSYPPIGFSSVGVGVTVGRRELVGSALGISVGRLPLHPKGSDASKKINATKIQKSFLFIISSILSFP